MKLSRTWHRASGWYETARMHLFGGSICHCSNILLFVVVIIAVVVVFFCDLLPPAWQVTSCCKPVQENGATFPEKMRWT